MEAKLDEFICLNRASYVSLEHFFLYFKNLLLTN